MPDRHPTPWNGQPQATLVEALRRQAERYGDKVAFVFSYNGDGENESRLTYRELDTRARAIGAGLQQQGAAGQRVLVICRPGLEAIAGFFGCLYAGAVAVPVHERLAPRLSTVIPDAGAGFALVAPATPAKIKAAVDALVGLIEEQPLRWCRTDVHSADAENWTVPDVDANTTAMIQYTSGSTRAPNGVVLTHANLMHNLATIHEVWPGDDRERAVYWLPPHHDMGLIGAILEMIYLGCTTVLMSPTAFIKRPMRWLEAISRNRGTFTTAPNFAYDLCVENSTPEERAALDLSSLATVMNGAEPVQAATMRRFADAFAPAGFRPEAFCPVYGLAEATLLVSGGSVSGGSSSTLPVVAHLDRGALEVDRVVDADPQAPTTTALVACGMVRGGQRVVIADPETRHEHRPEEIGEIWVAGPSVAQGYWDKPEHSAQTFAAYLAGSGQGPFLRTGDLGFLRDGQLFVTGRCKDLLVIRGAKYYPNDIELTVQNSHPAFVAGRGAAFTVDTDGETDAQLVIVQEVNRPQIDETEFSQIVAATAAAVDEHHRLTPDSIILVEHLRIPTTSSGKIQRGACRQLFFDRSLDTVAEWYAPRPRRPEDPNAARLAEIIDAARSRRRRAARPM